MKIIVLIFEFHLKPALIQVMALHWTGNNPFPESFCQPHRMGHGQHLNLTWIFGTNVQKSALHMLSNSGNDSAKWHSLLALSAQTAFMKKCCKALFWSEPYDYAHLAPLIGHQQYTSSNAIYSDGQWLGPCKNTLRWRQNHGHCLSNNLKCIFFNKKSYFHLNFTVSLFLRVQLAVSQHWFR